LKVIEELSEIDRIKRIQEIGIHSANSKEKIQAIEAISVYGNKAIFPLFDIIGSSTDQMVKTYGYKTILKIKTYFVI
jgi:hypothetical protein